MLGTGGPRISALAIDCHACGKAVPMNQMAEHECQASTSETLHTRRQIHTAAVHGELSPTLPDCPRMSVEPARFHRLKAYLSEQHRVPAMPQRLTGTRTPQQAIDTGAPQRVPDAGLPKGFPGSGMPQRVTRDVSMPQSQRTAAPMQRRSGAPLFEHPRPAPPARQHTRSDTVSTVSTTAPSSLGLSGAHGYSSSMSSVGSGSTAAAAKTQLCRHCRQPVIGKSVSSRDGKLSGRYHPECFNCYTCGTAFPNMEFYVYDDRPFCHVHYHEQNGSLCQTCGRGIEGQCIQSQRGLHHTQCFRCHYCGMFLSHEYYELQDGRVLCAADVMSLMQPKGHPSQNRAQHHYPTRRKSRILMI